MMQTRNEILGAAATTALRAPSVFNTQPWRWVLEGDVLQLRADRRRALTTTDPNGWLLLTSCGAALHHARLRVVRAGYAADVLRLPYLDRPDVLAEVRVGQPGACPPDDLARYGAIERRRTDRRPFGDTPVGADVVARLRDAAEAEDMHLHRVELSQMPMFAIAVARAEAAELADAEYRTELLRWIDRPEWSNDGVPSETGVRHAPRRVSIREFTAVPAQGMPVTPGGDRGAAYLVLYGPRDDDLDWLRAGEALSSVLLTAVSLGLSVAPFSDVIEIPETRALVQRILRPGGYPYIAVRCGYGPPTDDLPQTPRREPGEAVRGLGDGRAE